MQHLQKTRGEVLQLSSEAVSPCWLLLSPFALPPIPYPVSPFFSHSCALFCAFLHSSKIQLFYFQSLPHSLPKTPGGGVGSRCYSKPKLPPTRSSPRASRKQGSHAIPLPFLITSLLPYLFASSSHQSPPCPRSVCYPRLSAGGSPIPPASEVAMNKTLKIVLIVVGVLVVVVLVAPFLMPVNQFRPIIEEKASAALGRKVELGNLSLSLLSGSLSADNISIGDDPKFSSSPFLTANSLNVGVEIMPLIFSKTLNVTGVTIASPQVTLLRNAAGQWNYSSLGGSAAKSQAKQPPAEKSSGESNAAADVSIKKLT